MKTFAKWISKSRSVRYEKGRVGLLVEWGFDSTHCSLGLSAMRIPGMNNLHINGFWSIAISLVIIEITLNIEDDGDNV